MNEQENRITDIHCLKCGAPARFDIIRQIYVCSYCGSPVGIKEALDQKKGFRKIRSEALKESLKNYKLFHAECSGCGADLVFDENEALSECAFCGRNLVRSEYTKSANMPESVIPFAITEEEAKERLAEWCAANKDKREAKKLNGLIGELKGFYLPYEWISGPLHMTASPMSGVRTFECEGLILDEYVSRSRQLDNLMLDGMEPFDSSALSEFEFGYLAGQRVKINDLSEDDLEKRAEDEAASLYTPSIRRIMQSGAVDVQADVSEAIRLPVLLPVYYVNKNGSMAAVNGQTGKVSVRALKDSYYYFLPWWLKAILASVIVCLILFGALFGFGMSLSEALFITGISAMFFLVVTLCYYSDTVRNPFRVNAGRKIYTSGEETFVREDGILRLNEKILERKIAPPVFFEKLGDEEKPVLLKFATFARVFKIALLALLVLFLPVIIALFLNGFDFDRLEPGGSAVWFCIMVPVVPIYVLKYGIQELHDRPWIYTIEKDGSLKRYKKKAEPGFYKDMITAVLRSFIVPPVCLAVWFGVASFCVMCWLTAFGW